MVAQRLALRVALGATAARAWALNRIGGWATNGGRHARPELAVFAICTRATLAAAAAVAGRRSKVLAQAFALDASRAVSEAHPNGRSPMSEAIEVEVSRPVRRC